MLEISPESPRAYGPDANVLGAAFWRTAIGDVFAHRTSHDSFESLGACMIDCVRGQPISFRYDVSVFGPERDGQTCVNPGSGAQRVRAHDPRSSHVSYDEDTAQIVLQL